MKTFFYKLLISLTFFMIIVSCSEDTNEINSECKSDKDCVGTRICEDKICKDKMIASECTKNEDCETGQICNNKLCEDEVVTPECTTDKDCSDDKICKNEKCEIKPVLVPEDWDIEDFDHVYDVGTDKEYKTPNDVPWESLAPSSIVRIFHRAEPYKSKWVINTRASADKPVVILGMPSENGDYPIISGNNATTREELNYWNENRSIIKIGGSNLPTDTEIPAFIYIENLDIRSARPAYNFSDDKGDSGTYKKNAAAVHMEIGENITLKNCSLSDSGNGLFVGSSVSNVKISGNHIFGNGIENSYYEHNTYTEALGIIYEYNYFGPLRKDCGGNNLKDRSAGTIIRYNWIESGNRQLDLVETGHDELLNHPSYNETFVYGNVLIEPDNAGNGQLIHYGGDGNDGAGETYYRKGTLYFYNNTVIATKSGNVTLINLSTNDVSVDIRNNILFSAAGSNKFAITTGRGITTLKNNWIQEGYRDTFEGEYTGTIDKSDNIEGTNPGFMDERDEIFNLNSDSPCKDAAGQANTDTSSHPVSLQYSKHQKTEKRDTVTSIGAFE